MPQYTKNPPLTEVELLRDPLQQLQRWLDDARSAEMIEPTAMSLATATPEGRPSARIVLFKGFHEGGLTFFTNYEGRKGQELERNPQAAAVFWWDRLERQVRVEGRVSRLAPELSQKYFHSRPRASQLGALTSRQSRVVANRAELDARLEQTVREHEGKPVPWPAFWGGYSLKPESLEFWQGRRDRLHDRLVYRREGSAWKVERLEP